MLYCSNCRVHPKSSKNALHVDPKKQNEHLSLNSTEEFDQDNKIGIVLGFS